MSTSSTWRSCLAALVALAVLTSGCRATPDITTVTATGGRIDFELTRDDIACEADDLNLYEDASFFVAHVVVDGDLGAPCLGQADPRLLQAWEILAAIAPPAQLSDLGLVGGYQSPTDDEITLGYVTPLDSSASQFHLAINLDAAEADPTQLMLTVAHEFSHVLLELPDQLDRSILPEECMTWDNGSGCYRPTSLLWEWIEMFWGDDLIDTIDPTVAPSNAVGEARCERNPGFLSSYAATNPEEDFAEAFAAFVFRLDVPTPELEAKMEWLASQPGLAEFRDRAIQASLGPLVNDFEPCGSAS